MKTHCRCPTLLLDVLNISTNQQPEGFLLLPASFLDTLYTPENSKIELFEGEKMFRHKIICIFGSGYMTACMCTFKTNERSANEGYPASMHAETTFLHIIFKSNSPQSKHILLI